MTFLTRKRVEAVEQQRQDELGEAVIQTVVLDGNRTQSLEVIRRLVNSGQSLSRAQAIFLMQRVNETAQLPQAIIDPANWGCAVDAFEVLVRMLASDRHHSFYLTNLSSGFSTFEVEDFHRVPFAMLAHEMIAYHRKLLGQTLAPDGRRAIASCLVVALRDEWFAEDELNAALSPFLPGLLRLAVRGHVEATGKPLKIIYDGSAFGRVHVSKNGLSFTAGSDTDAPLFANVEFDGLSGFILGGFGDFYALSRALESCDIDPKGPGKFCLSTLPDKNRVRLRVDQSYHHITTQHAAELAIHLLAVLQNPQHSDLIDALRSAYGD